MESDINMKDGLLAALLTAHGAAHRPTQYGEYCSVCIASEYDLDHLYSGEIL